MRIVIDMNLSPAWVSKLEQAGHDATHWSSLGRPDAPDREVLQFAGRRGAVLFTHDLDFGAILAATGAESPSVLQVHTEDPSPERCGRIVQRVLDAQAEALSRGALISVDEARSRVRLLPLANRRD